MKIPSLNLPRADWSQADWIGSLYRVPALIILLELGLFFHQTALGVVAAGTAFSVGLVGERQVNGSRLLAMVVTTVLMAFSALVGTLTGDITWLSSLVAALWGLVFAFLSVHDDDSGWIAMQGIIALVIASSFPSHGAAAAARAVGILSGGLLQLSLVVLCRSFTHSFPGLSGWSGKTTGDTGKKGKAVFRWSDLFVVNAVFTAAWHYAIRMSVTLIVALETGRALHIQNGYWLPMTTIIILKPDFYRTYSGGVQRVGGTLAGVLFASLVAHWFAPKPGWLLLLVALFSLGCFALVKVQPIFFSASLTIYVVFVIAFTGLPEATITWHRLAMTAFGSVLAIISGAIGYHGFFKSLRRDSSPLLSESHS